MLFLILTLLSFSAFADCQHYIRQQERELGIPTNLLKSISIVESGKKVGKQIISWPWTINVGGKGYRFSNKKKAVTFAKKLIKQGKKSFDVGCMQINLKYHPYAFRNLEEAFDPQINVAYAGRLFSKLRNQFSSWQEAVGYYHSWTKSHNDRYRTKVLKQWDVLGKIIPLIDFRSRKPLIQGFGQNQSKKKKGHTLFLTNHRGLSNLYKKGRIKVNFKRYPLFG